MQCPKCANSCVFLGMLLTLPNPIEWYSCEICGKEYYSPTENEKDEEVEVA